MGTTSTSSAKKFGTPSDPDDIDLSQWPLPDEHRSNLIRVVWGERVDPELPSPPVLQLQRVDASRHHVLLRSDQEVARPLRGYINLRRIVVDLGVCGIETELVPLEDLSPEVMHFRSPHELTNGSYINLDVYQTEMRFAMVFSLAEIVTTMWSTTQIGSTT
jgi:hypothetical protein